MKNCIKFQKYAGLLLCLCLPLMSWALDTGVTYAVFSTPEQSYIEINIGIAGQTVTYKPIDSTQMQAGVEVLILIKRGNEIVNYEKYILNSPIVSAPEALLDVKRLFIANGVYTLEVQFLDINNANNKDLFSTNFKVEMGKTLYLSEIQLLNKFRPDAGNGPFNKNGYFLEPLPFGYYDRYVTKLGFYAEIYHADMLNTEYQMRYFIEKIEGNNLKSLISVGTQQKKPAPIDAILVQMDISKLESGNYTLTVELRSSSNEVMLTRSIPFQRINPFLNFDETNLTDDMMDRQFVRDMDEKSLKFTMRAISATVTTTEAEILNGVLRSDDLKAMRFYVFRHFVRINQNNPEEAFRSYIENANAVHARFQSGFRYGFETDRGRTYLRFGKPDDMVHVEDDPSAPPYEIWIYYTFPKTGQQNVKFLFYNPTLAGEDFILLHSTARGEIRNPKWERVLYSRNAADQEDGDNYNDATGVKRNIARNAKVYFDDF